MNHIDLFSVVRSGRAWADSTIEDLIRYPRMEVITSCKAARYLSGIKEKKNHHIDGLRDRQTIKWQGGPFNGSYIIHCILSYITLSAGTKIRLVRALPQNLSLRLNVELKL